MADLAISVKLYTGASTYIELNDKATFWVADGSFENQAVQHRRKTATSPFVEGEYVVSNLRGNVTEQLNVYVKGATQYAVRSSLKTLQTALEQQTFQVVRTIDNWKTTWTCYASDYTMQSSKPLLHSKLVLVQIQLIRDPVETIASV
jgi:hypothetical protein